MNNQKFIKGVLRVLEEEAIQRNRTEENDPLTRHCAIRCDYVLELPSIGAYIGVRKSLGVKGYCVSFGRSWAEYEDLSEAVFSAFSHYVETDGFKESILSSLRYYHQSKKIDGIAQQIGEMICNDPDMDNTIVSIEDQAEGSFNVTTTSKDLDFNHSLVQEIRAFQMKNGAAEFTVLIEQ